MPPRKIGPPTTTPTRSGTFFETLSNPERRKVFSLLGAEFFHVKHQRWRQAECSPSSCLEENDTAAPPALLHHPRASSPRGHLKVNSQGTAVTLFATRGGGQQPSSVTVSRKCNRKTTGEPQHGAEPQTRTARPPMSSSSSELIINTQDREKDHVFIYRTVICGV